MAITAALILMLALAALLWIRQQNLELEAEHLHRLVEDLQRSREAKRAMTAQIVALQKFEAIGQMAGSLAHDFNNVVGAIQSWAELAKEEAEPGSSLADRLQRLCNQTGRAAALTRQMLALSHAPVLEPGDVSLNDLIREATGFLKNVIGTGIEVRTSLARDLPGLRADPTQIEQLSMNMIIAAS